MEQTANCPQAEKARIELFGKSICFNGVSPQVIDHVSEGGLTSFQRFGSGFTIAWWDWNNATRRMKDLGVIGASLTNPQLDADYINRLVRYNKMLKYFDEDIVDLATVDFGMTQYQVQKNGSAFLLFRRVAALYDEMGLGKTSEAIYAYALLQKHFDRPVKCLVLCPMMTKPGWAKEFKKCINKTAVYAENAGADDNIVLAHYEQLITRKKSSGEVVTSKTLERLLDWPYDVLIVDEAHYCKNMKSSRAKAFESLTDRKVVNAPQFDVGKFTQSGEPIKSFGKLPYLWFLTGTPMERPKDIYNMLRHAFGRDFPRIWKFLDQYTTFETKHFYGRVIKKPTGVKNLDALNDLVSQISLRRERSAIKEIPYIEHTVYLTHNDEYEDAYWELVESKDHPLSAIIAGIEFCNYPPMTGSKLASVKHRAALEAVQSSQGKVVIWSSFVAPLEALKRLLESEGVSCCTFLGDDKLEVTEKQFESAKVCLATVSKGSVGVNFMRAATTVIYLEKPMSYTLWSQSRDRVMRIDRDTSKPVLFLTLEIDECPTEELLTRIIREKTELAKLVLGSGIKLQRPAK